MMRIFSYSVQFLQLYMSYQIPQSLKNLLIQLTNDDNYHKALSQGAKQYYLTPYKINRVTPTKISKLFQILSRKFYCNDSPVTVNWYQNELKIFVWLIVGYSYLKKKHINQLSQEDWDFFSRIFNFRSIEHIQFQAKSLVRIPKRQNPWTTKQINLLFSIISTKQKIKWNEIAFQFFSNSEKMFFRTSKQCREQWLNHLDPSKNRSQWTTQQDIFLLESIIQVGKKWSEISKLLQGTRTQHMVKNRYNSLIKQYAKEHSYFMEDQLLQSIIQNLKKKKKTKVSPTKCQTIQQQDFSFRERTIQQNNAYEEQQDLFYPVQEMGEKLASKNTFIDQFDQRQSQRHANSFNMTENLDYVSSFLI